MVDKNVRFVCVNSFIFILFLLVVESRMGVAFLPLSLVPYATAVSPSTYCGGGGAIDKRAMSSSVVLLAAEWWDV